MKAMILAAGYGSRMQDLTRSKPKPLLEVQGKPLIVHRLEALSRAGFCEVVINVSYLGYQIKALLGTGEHWGVSIVYSEEMRPLETGGGIYQALSHLGDTPFLIVNADLWTDFDFKKLLQTFEDDTLAHLVLVDNPSHHEQGDFCFDEVTRNVWLPDPGLSDEKCLPRLTYSGISILHPKLFADVSCEKFPLRDVLVSAMQKGQVTGEYFNGTWVDVGTRERLQKLQS